MSFIKALDWSWARLWSELNLPGDGEETRQQLVAAWTEPHRSYHTLQHLSAVRGMAPHPAEIEFALWFHDAIYDATRSDNEARSADWASATLAKACASTDSIRLVHDLIMVTRHAALLQTLDEHILVDVDLSILGADEQRYTQFEQQVRQEYAFVPGFLFRMKRKSILRAFLEREHIYSTQYFRERLEEPARRNLVLAVS